MYDKESHTNEKSYVILGTTGSSSSTTLSLLRNFFASSWQRNLLAVQSNDSSLRAEELPLAINVYLAKKALNLNEIFFNEEIAVNGCEQSAADYIQLRKTAFTTQSGLIAKAPELARYYTKHHCFPQFFIIDELALTGYDYTDFVYRLEKAIYSSLITLWAGKFEFKEYSFFRSKLISAIDFRTYMRDRRRLLVENPLYAQVRHDEICSSSRCLTFSLDVSSFISENNVENTDFIPTFTVSSSTYASICNRLESTASWYRSDPESIHGSATVFQRRLSRFNEVVVHFALFCRLNSQEDTIHITPYVIWRDMTLEDSQALYIALAQHLKVSGLKKMAAIFEMDFWGCSTIQKQMLLTISAILLFMSIYDGLGAASDLQTDLEKVSQLYGFIEEFEEDFSTLINTPELRRHLSERILKTLYKFASPMWKDLPLTKRSDLAPYMRHAESYFWQLECEEQENQQNRRKEENWFSPWSDTADYKCGIFEAYLSNFPSELNSPENKIAVLLFLIHQNYISLQIPKAEKAASGKVIPFYMAVGESTFALAFLPLEPYLLALCKLEDWCTKNGLSTARWGARFGRFLDKNGCEGNLQELFSSRISSIYEYGAMLNDWPARFYCSGELAEQNEKYCTLLSEFFPNAISFL